MKKILSLVFALLMLFTTLATAFAEGPQPRNSNCFHMCSVTVGDAGDGVVSMTFSTTGMGICSTLGVASFYVEKQNDDGSWSIVSGPRAGSCGNNVATYSCGYYFYGKVGETYRITATFIATLNGETDTRILTSPIIETE